MSQVKNEVAFAESEAMRTDTDTDIELMPPGDIKIPVTLCLMGLAAGALAVCLSVHIKAVFRRNPDLDSSRPNLELGIEPDALIACGVLVLLCNSVALIVLAAFRHRRRHWLVAIGPPLVGFVGAVVAMVIGLVPSKVYTIKRWSCDLSSFRHYTESDGPVNWNHLCIESWAAYAMTWVLLVVEMAIASWVRGKKVYG